MTILFRMGKQAHFTVYYCSNSNYIYKFFKIRIQPADFFKEKYQVNEVYFSEQTNQISDVLKKKNVSTLLTLYGKNSDSGNFTKEIHFSGINDFNVDKSILHHEISEWYIQIFIQSK